MAVIVFDLDGTLIDSAPDIHAAVNRMLAHEDAAPMTLAQVKGLIGNGVPALIEQVMITRNQAVGPARHAVLSSQFMAHYNANPATLTRLYHGVQDALEALLTAGHRLALCTNKPEVTARNILTAFEINHFFTVVIGGDSLPSRKPDPAPLHAAIAAAGGGDALYVGDSEVDAMTATAAGVPLLLFTEGYRKVPTDELTHVSSFARFADLPDRVADQLDRSADARLGWD